MAKPQRVADESTHMPLIVRGFSGRRGHHDPPKRVEQWPRQVLILDTETTTDPTQRLLFGSYQYAYWELGRLVTKVEGLFCADDLVARDPDGFETLQVYAEDHGLELVGRREFVDRALWLAAYGIGAMVVGFNLPFDLSRLAVGHGFAKHRNRGGFSFILWDYWDKTSREWKESPYRPRLIVKHRNSKSAFIEFGTRQGVLKEHQRRGRFLDLRTLTYALTSEGYTLRAACEAFGLDEGKGAAERHGVITPDYIDYNRQDVTATGALLEATRTAFERYPIELDPCKALSPAAIAKACLRSMGVTPPMPRFKNVSDQVHGRAMVAYFGGRAEVRTRRTTVPVVTTDFVSMYPTVNALLGLWRYVTARELQVVDVTERVRRQLTASTLDGCFDPATWKDLMVLAEVRPEGHVLPVRARYDGTNRNIGTNHLSSDVPLWYAGPDLVASALLTGRPPDIIQAIGLRATGTADGLRPIELGFGISIDPTEEDFFRRMIELRKSLEGRGLDPLETKRLGRALKIIVNSGSYGIFAEMQTNDRNSKDPFVVHGLDTFDSLAEKRDKPGVFAFPFFAAVTTAAARLMLAMLERCVTDQGGSYAFCDTDSMAIIASLDGGTMSVEGDEMRVLSYADVERIRERLAALSPYDPDVVSGSILAIEAENFDSDGRRRQLFAYAISAKRYALLA